MNTKEAPTDRPTSEDTHWRNEHHAYSLAEVHRSIEVPHGKSVLRMILAFTGPGLLVAVGYMDPGNWATDLAGEHSLDTPCWS